VNDDDWARLNRKEHAIAELTNILRGHRHENDTLEHHLRRPDCNWRKLRDIDPRLAEWDRRPEVVEQVALEAKYSGYIHRQAQQVERFQRLESKPIPAHFDFSAVPQLRAEAREKLARIRPASLGQASRISGICPADLAVVMIYLESRACRQPVTSSEEG
jgi:tRNA uridine 5-carboxymethylaminomethyl modification enzyme